MKKFKPTNLVSFVLLLLVGFSFVSCSNETDDEATSGSLTSVKNDLQSVNSSRDGGKIDTVFALESSRVAAVSFTREIKAFYKPGMSYSDLKHELDPNGNLSNITTAGDALLYEAYSNIVNGVGERDIKGLKMMQALEYVLEHNIKTGATKVEDVNLESGSKLLFGLDESYVTTARAQPCKWYNIFCHLGNFWNWLAGDANGDQPGSTTNGQILGTVLGAVSSVIAIISAVSGGD